MKIKSCIGSWLGAFGEQDRYKRGCGSHWRGQGCLSSGRHRFAVSSHISCPSFHGDLGIPRVSGYCL